MVPGWLGHSMPLSMSCCAVAQQEMQSERRQVARGRDHTLSDSCKTVYGVIVLQELVATESWGLGPARQMKPSAQGPEQQKQSQNKQTNIFAPPPCDLSALPSGSLLDYFCLGDKALQGRLKSDTAVCIVCQWQPQRRGQPGSSTAAPSAERAECAYICKQQGFVNTLILHEPGHQGKHLTLPDLLFEHCCAVCLSVRAQAAAMSAGPHSHVTCGGCNTLLMYPQVSRQLAWMHQCCCKPALD